MNLARMILREIAHRKANSGLSLLSATIAAACFVGALTLMKSDRLRTEQLLAERREAVAKAGAELEDSMRKIMKGLGFNVIILPEDQDLNELHLQGGLSKSMPESYVDRLANSEIVTVNHLLPTVMRKVKWPERNAEVILYGTRGEVPILHRDPKKPLLDAVPPGGMIVGHQLARRFNLSQGDSIPFQGKEFTVLKIHEERGTVDDSTIWIHLGEAQRLLGMENLIHAVQALECHCTGDRIGQIRKEIAAILPGTQVIERGPPALARAEARTQAKESAEAALAQEKESRAALQRQRERLASLMAPLALAGCAVWMGFLAAANVRERKTEIGILRALGYDAKHILLLFAGKALFLGAAGALLGFGLGFYIGGAAGELAREGDAAVQLFTPFYLLAAGAIAVAVSGVGCFIPAMAAARQDPAVVLQEN